MIKFKSTNAEELTEMTAWTIRDHLGEYVNFHIGDGSAWEEDGAFFECALAYWQVEVLRDKLTEWLKNPARANKTTSLANGEKI